VLGEYIYLGDQLLAMIRPGEVAYYFHNDHLGTPQALTNDSQAIAWKSAYAPFGEAVPSIQTVENPFRFPGQYYDQETGLYYNYHRYYDPMTGRYITPDPIGLEGGVNLFAYVQNNPVNKRDTFGLLGKGECPPGHHRAGPDCAVNADNPCNAGYYDWGTGQCISAYPAKMEIPPWVCELGVHVGCHILCESSGASPLACGAACIAAAALVCGEKCE
jgi:RHS repeat-associated protein